jgi:hypothetical protein
MPRWSTRPSTVDETYMEPSEAIATPVVKSSTLGGGGGLGKYALRCQKSSVGAKAGAAPTVNSARNPCGSAAT